MIIFFSCIIFYLKYRYYIKAVKLSWKNGVETQKENLSGLLQWVLDVSYCSCHISCLFYSAFVHMDYVFCIRSNFTTVDTIHFPWQKILLELSAWERTCLWSFTDHERCHASDTLQGLQWRIWGFHCFFQWKTLLQAIQQKLRQHISNRISLI